MHEAEQRPESSPGTHETNKTSKQTKLFMTTISFCVYIEMPFVLMRNDLAANYINNRNKTS